MNIRHGIIICIMSILLGCAGKPIVEIEIADAIFIEPESLDNANIYVNIRNQSGIYGIERAIASETRTLLEEKGYDIRTKAVDADIYLRAVILHIMKEDKDLNLKEAFAVTAATTIGGAMIGSIANDSNRGKGAGIGAGIGAGVGILGIAIAQASKPIFWYGLVEVEIAEPQQKRVTTTQKIKNKRAENKKYVNNTVDGMQDFNIDQMREQNIITNEEESVIVTEGGKKKSRTKMMIRVRGNINAEEAGKAIQEALSHRLANFF